MWVKFRRADAGWQIKPEKMPSDERNVPEYVRKNGSRSMHCAWTAR